MKKIILFIALMIPLVTNAQWRITGTYEFGVTSDMYSYFNYTQQDSLSPVIFNLKLKVLPTTPLNTTINTDDVVEFSLYNQKLVNDPVYVDGVLTEYNTYLKDSLESVISMTPLQQYSSSITPVQIKYINPNDRIVAASYQAASSQWKITGYGSGMKKIVVKLQAHVNGVKTSYTYTMTNQERVWISGATSLMKLTKPVSMSQGMRVNTNSLEWKTDSLPATFSKFKLTKSYDSAKFFYKASIAANGENKYTFVDDSLKRTSYYRLYEVETTGNQTFLGTTTYIYKPPVPVVEPEIVQDSVVTVPGNVEIVTAVEENIEEKPITCKYYSLAGQAMDPSEHGLKIEIAHYRNKIVKRLVYTRN